MISGEVITCIPLIGRVRCRGRCYLRRPCTESFVYTLQEKPGPEGLWPTGTPVVLQPLHALHMVSDLQRTHCVQAQSKTAIAHFSNRQDQTQNGQFTSRRHLCERQPRKEEIAGRRGGAKRSQD